MIDVYSKIDDFKVNIPILNPKPQPAYVEQVAKSPFEVLVNMNRHLTDLVLKHDIADALITVIRGVDEYAKFFHVDFEQVEINEVEPVNRGITVTYKEREQVGPSVVFQRGSIDWLAFNNEMAARWCMDERNLDGLYRYIFCMHHLAQVNGLDITDIGTDDLRWLNGRNDLLFIGF